MSRLVLVTGAGGALGPRMVESLREGGFSIRTLSFDQSPVGLWPDDVETVLGDVTDRDTVRTSMKGVEIVVHLAALLHIADPAPDLRPRFERVNIEGTRIVVEEALRAGVQRLVFFSTIAVYGNGHGRWLTEDSMPQPATLYAETKFAAEQVVQAARRFDSVPLGVVLRLGAVYGSRVKGNYQRLVAALARKRFLPIGGGANRRSLVYDKDVAKAMLLAIQHAEAAGRTYNVTDGEAHSIKEVTHAICAALGRRPPRLYLPAGLARVMAALAEDVARLFHFQPKIGRGTVEKYLEDVAVDGQRIQVELGFRPSYDLFSGWADAIQEMRSSGTL